MEEKATGSFITSSKQKKQELSFKGVKCLHCDKPLRTIGKARIDGKSHKDWSTRKYHKKCYLILKDNIRPHTFKNGVFTPVVDLNN